MGHKRGKGENLWKAIYQLKGDIIVYVDADIKNIHPRFVTGIVAPLIYNQSIKYCKAFYDRPMAYSSGIRPSGGGRVTEILIRPLFSLFFPELTALIQPLSGEFAVRREVLERIARLAMVETRTYWTLPTMGPRGLRQCDLDQRIHRNQSTNTRQDVLWYSTNLHKSPQEFR